MTSGVIAIIPIIVVGAALFGYALGHYEGCRCSCPKKETR